MKSNEKGEIHLLRLKSKILDEWYSNLVRFQEFKVNVKIVGVID